MIFNIIPILKKIQKGNRTRIPNNLFPAYGYTHVARLMDDVYGSKMAVARCNRLYAFALQLDYNIEDWAPVSDSKDGSDSGRVSF